MFVFWDQAPLNQLWNLVVYGYLQSYLWYAFDTHYSHVWWCWVMTSGWATCLSYTCIILWDLSFIGAEQERGKGGQKEVVDHFTKFLLFKIILFLHDVRTLYTNPFFFFFFLIYAADNTIYHISIHNAKKLLYWACLISTILIYSLSKVLL